MDGWIWGRGALDMKGGVAMMLAAFLRANEDASPPPGDVIFCALSDEEGFGGYGAGFMVDEHPELFDGVTHAIGEFGGFALEMGLAPLLSDPGRREAGLRDKAAPARRRAVTEPCRCGAARWPSWRGRWSGSTASACRCT